jgi:predicted small secreted protein
MKTAMKSAASLALVAIVLSTLLLVACNTTKGVGQDIEAVGSGIESSADRNGAK